MRKGTQRAFTLIEILIVVVILGILAAIVIPQFTDASTEAMESSVRAQLQTIRGQIELFKVQNPASTAYDDGSAVADFWGPLVVNDYLQQAPKNPMQNNSTTVAIAPAVGVGWVWLAGDLTAVDPTGGDFTD
ncbi:MAG: prepilin-type N-terminal cleavage/methylation domain-containing protein [Planctomycetes bacterium]|nr:prepilin-type N-terminal cleavage/methylation domain-containing protein [Planctomycetota bacterium]